MIPPDLVLRVREASQQLDDIERRLGVVEAMTRDGALAVEQLKVLRHDFAQMRQAIMGLMTEIDARDPIPNPTSAPAKKAAT